MKVIQSLLPFFVFLPVITLTGCRSHSPSGLLAPPATIAPAGEQSQMTKVVQDYVVSLQSQDYQKAETMMSPTFRASTPPDRLKTLLKGADLPLLGAKNLQFDPVQLSSHSSHVVLRGHFLGSDGKSYRANFLLAQSSGAWQVSGLIPPATHRAPVSRKGKASSM